jgi:cytochrome P450
METIHATTLPKVPSAKPRLSIREIAALLQNPLETLQALTRRNDGIAAFKVLHKKFIVVDNVDYFKSILQEQYKHFHKYDLSGLLTKFLGDGLITSNGQFWLQQRRAVQPAFHKQQVENMAGVINLEVDKLINSLKKEVSSKPIPMGKLFMSLNLAILTRMFFGETADREMKLISEIMNDMAFEADNQMNQIVKVPLIFPSPGNLRFKKVIKKFDAFLYSTVDKRKKLMAVKAPVQQDILQMLLDYRSDDFDGLMPAKQIRDELATLFLAGYETTSQTLSWLFYKVAGQAEIATAIREEVGNCHSTHLTLNELPKLKYTTAVIKETMRLYPAVWLIVRKSISNTVLGNYFLPKKTIILLNVYGIHHNENYWDKPEEFRPDRFDEANMKLQHPFSYLPFGIGPRVCIGQSLAMMVMQIVVGRLIASFKCTLAENYETSLEPRITLRPKPAIHMVLTPIP